ncbi:hypothetical protein DPEC_G00320710 [Dallia pectoralis]|uniref:Uncharacterized protein n=1 Tax=Dallia pectoralis TaxID=75939 RepID=A0ACC2FA03_DALPE|nr:hypothetical protein DPEC_G00320710 [Dallia pectoralis]
MGGRSCLETPQAGRAEKAVSERLIDSRMEGQNLNGSGPPMDTKQRATVDHCPLATRPPPFVPLVSIRGPSGGTEHSPQFRLGPGHDNYLRDPIRWQNEIDNYEPRPHPLLPVAFCCYMVVWVTFNLLTSTPTARGHSQQWAGPKAL